MKSQFDLHLHSQWSYDACIPVEWYFAQASQLGLKAIAITDHHTMDGLDNIKSAAKKFPDVRFFAGVEITVATSIGAVDLVCLNLPLSPPAGLERIFEHYRIWKRKHGDAGSTALQHVGINFSHKQREKILRTYRPEKCLLKHGITHVPRHIQRVYFEKWHFSQGQKEFDELLKKAAPHALWPPCPQASEVLPVIKSHGGIIFLAHPVVYAGDNIYKLDQLREELAFDGLECAHTLIPHTLTGRYRKYCLEHGLLSSAGSDTHCSKDHNYAVNVNSPGVFAHHSGKIQWLKEIKERVKLH